MATFSEAIAQATKSTLCAVAIGSDNVTSFTNSLVGLDGDTLNVGRAFRRLVCDDSNDQINPPPTTEVPFTGGQCPGVLYSVSGQGFDFQTKRCNNGDIQDNSGPYNRGPVTVTGPITNIFRRDVSGSCGVGRRGYEWVAVANAGIEVALFSVVTGFPSQVYANSFGAMNITVVRADGQPDTCGDPDVVIPPFSPITTTVNVEYEDNSQTTINEDVDITVFAPFVAIGGAIIAPVTVTGNDFSLVGEVNLDGSGLISFEPDIDFNFGKGGGDSPAPSPDPSIETPEPESGSGLIVGAIVTATPTGQGRATQILQGVNPDIFAPRIGNISFYVNTPSGQAWTEDAPIKNLRQYVPCPYLGGAADVKATAEPGYSLNVTPHYSKPIIA
jgi:hypothetical protein